MDVKVHNLVALCFFVCRDFLAHTKLVNLTEHLLAGQHGKAKRKTGCEDLRSQKNGFLMAACIEGGYIRNC